MPRIGVAIKLNWPVRHHHDVIRGIQRFADEQGDWELEVGAFPDLRMAMGHPYDGIVGRIRPSLATAAKAAGIPIVNTWISSPVVTEVHCVLADSGAAARIGMEHLYARGLRQFTHIGVRGQLASIRHYQEAAATAKKLGVPLQRLFAAADLEKDETTWKGFVKTIEAVVSSWQPPVGVICVNDGIARALVFELERLGIDVPRDVAVVGTGDEPIYCTHLFPTLSSVRHGYNRGGYEAARLLGELMQDNARPLASVLVPPEELVVRDSSDFFAVNNPRVAAALRFMAENSSQLVSVKEIAQAAGISQQNLNVLFHRYLGHTVGTELTRLRIEHFKRLLVETDEPLRVLSRRAGFGSQSLVYGAFKRFTGQTPAAYREQRRSLEWQ